MYRKASGKVFLQKLTIPLCLCWLVLLPGAVGQEEDPYENKSPWPPAPGYDDIPTTRTPPNPWRLAIDINTQISCGGSVKQGVGGDTLSGMTADMSCDATSIKDAAPASDVNSEGLCRRWCEGRIDSNGEKFTFLSGVACEWDGTTCNMCSGAHVTLIKNLGWKASLCLEATDFVYESEMWQSKGTDFDWTNTVPIVDENDFSPRANTKYRAKYKDALNRMYEEYDTMQISHIRIEMCAGVQCSVNEFAVTPERAGRVSLREFVTSPGGSAASTYDIDNKKDGTFRGEQSSPFNFQSDLDGNTFFCWHLGFNSYVLAGKDRRAGDQARTGRGPGNPEASFQPAPRVRIGMAKGPSFPCNEYLSAEGIGMDLRYNRPGKRLQAGLLQYADSSRTIFRTTKVWVTNTLDASFARRPHMFRPFGSLREESDPIPGQPTHGRDSTFALLSQMISNIPGKDGIDWEEGRMTFSFFLKLRRDYTHIHYPGWSRKHRDIMRYGFDSDLVNVPTLTLYTDTRRSQNRNDPNLIDVYANSAWNGDSQNGRRMYWHTSTTREPGDDGKPATSDRWNGSEDQFISFTLGRWHHVTCAIDMHSMTTYIDGQILAIYPFAAGKSGNDVILRETFSGILYLSEYNNIADAPVIHDFRAFQKISLEQNEIAELARAFPRANCGDGIRVVGEGCDDGNIASGDGCSSTCEIEDTFICREGNTTYMTGSTCLKGDRNLYLDFESTNYDGGNIDTTIYNPAEWNTNGELPKIVEMKRTVIRNTATPYEVQSHGVVQLTVGPTYARSGNNGLQVLLRNRWFVKPYEVAAETATWTSVTTETGTGTSMAWKDMQGEVRGHGVVESSIQNVGTNNWVHGPFAASAGGEFTRWMRTTIDSLPKHTLIRLKFKFWSKNFCVGDVAVVEADGDAVFAHVKTTAVGTGGEFLDSLRNGGTLSNQVYVHTTSNEHSAQYTNGWVRPARWTVGSSTNGAPSGSGWFFHDVDVTMPHWEGSLTLDLRYVSSCSNANEWAFQYVQVFTKNTGKGEFRPENFFQTLNKDMSQSPFYSWMQMDIDELIQPDSYLSYSFKIVRWPQYGRSFDVLLMDKTQDDAYAATDRLNIEQSDCQSTSGCSGQFGCSACRGTLETRLANPGGTCTGSDSCRIFYKLCYSQNQYGAACDESSHPTYGVWHDENVEIGSKFGSRYAKTTSLEKRKLRIQFGFWSKGADDGGDDSEIEIHFDDIKVSTPIDYEAAGAFGCGTVAVSAEATLPTETAGSISVANKEGVNFWVGGFSAADGGVDKTLDADGFDCKGCKDFLSDAQHIHSSCTSLTSGFALMTMPRKCSNEFPIPAGKVVGDMMGSPTILWGHAGIIKCFNPAGPNDVGFRDAVAALKYGDRILVASFGSNSECHEISCAPTFTRIGAPELTWNKGFSMALIGRKGTTIGSIPMRLALSGEGGVLARSMFLCPNIVSSVSETTYQFASVSPAMGLLNTENPLEARFKLQTHTGGYLGCFNDRGWWGHLGQGQKDMWYPCFSNSIINTPAVCAKCCEGKGFTVAGLSWAYHQCQCGDTYGSYSINHYNHANTEGSPQLPDSACSHHCISDPLQTCGGGWWRWLNGHTRATAVFQTTGESYARHNYYTVAGSGSNIARLNDNSEGNYAQGPNSNWILTFTFKDELPKMWLSRLRISWWTRSNSIASSVQIYNSRDGNSWQTTELSSTKLTGYGNVDIYKINDPSLECSVKKLKIMLVGRSIRVREIWLNYFEYADADDEKYDHLVKAYQPSRALSQPFDAQNYAEYKKYRLKYVSGGAQHRVHDFWDVTKDGTVFLKNAILNFESQSDYKVEIAAYSNGYEWSGTMEAQSVTSYLEGPDYKNPIAYPATPPSFVEINNPLGTIPGIVIIDAVVTDNTGFGGASANFRYRSVGVVMADEEYDERHGGVLAAISSTKIRLWVPKASDYFRSGYAIHVGYGWGSSRHMSRRSANVVVTLRPTRPPEFDSGWFDMRSNHMLESYKEINHKLGLDRASGGKNVRMDTAKVKVTYRTKDKNHANYGFVFEATGSQQADGSGGRYGGLVYAYNNKYVRIWAPNFAGMTRRLAVEDIRTKHWSRRSGFQGPCASFGADYVFHRFSDEPYKGEQGDICKHSPSGLPTAGHSGKFECPEGCVVPPLASWNFDRFAPEKPWCIKAEHDPQKNLITRKYTPCRVDIDEKSMLFNLYSGDQENYFEDKKLPQGTRVAFLNTFKFDGLKTITEFDVPAGDVTSVPLAIDTRKAQVDLRGPFATTADGISIPITRVTVSIEKDADGKTRLTAAGLNEATFFHPSMTDYAVGTSHLQVNDVLTVTGTGHYWKCQVPNSPPRIDGTFDGTHTVTSIAGDKKSFTIKQTSINGQDASNPCIVIEGFDLDSGAVIGPPAASTVSSEFYKNNAVLDKHHIQVITTTAPDVDEVQFIVVHNTGTNKFRVVNTAEVPTNDWKSFSCTHPAAQPATTSTAASPQTGGTIRFDFATTGRSSSDVTKQDILSSISVSQTATLDGLATALGNANWIGPGGANVGTVKGGSAAGGTQKICNIGTVWIRFNNLGTTPMVAVRGKVPDMSATVSSCSPPSCSGLSVTNPTNTDTGQAAVVGEFKIGVESAIGRGQNNFQTQWTEAINYRASASTVQLKLEAIGSNGPLSQYRAPGTYVDAPFINVEDTTMFNPPYSYGGDSSNQMGWSVTFTNSSYGYLDAELYGGYPDFRGHVGGDVGSTHPWMRDLKVRLNGGGNYKTGTKACDMKTVVTKDSGASANFCPLMGSDAAITVCLDYDTRSECTQSTILLRRASVPGNSLLGSFKVWKDSSSSNVQIISYKATAADMQSKIRTLTGLSQTTVTRYGPDNHNGYSWTITFKDSSSRLVEHDQLVVDSAGLTTTAFNGKGTSPVDRVLRGTPNSVPPPASKGSVLSFGLYRGKRTSPAAYCSNGAVVACSSTATCAAAGTCCCDKLSSGTCMGVISGIKGTCIDMNQRASVVRYPDAYDCGLMSQPCYKKSDSTSDECCGTPQKASLHGKYKSLGRCPDGEKLGVCVPYLLRSDMKEGKIINVPAGRGWGDHPTDTTYQFEDEAEVRV